MMASSSPRILIVKIGALGDIFFTLPALASIKETWPNCQIDWLISSAVADALSGFHEITNVIKVDDRKLYRGFSLKKFWHALQLRQKLSRYDAILLFHRHPAYLIPLLGKGRIFQLTRKQNFLGRLVHQTAVPALSLHESLAIQKTTNNMIASLGAMPPNRWSISRKIKSSGKIVVHLGGGDNFKTEFRLKRWPNMVDLIDKISSCHKEKIVLVGSPAETQDANVLCGKVKNREQIESLVGKTSLSELVQVISEARVFIGPDSGPLHIADQLGVPAVGIYGPTSPISWGLLGSKGMIISNFISCQPCYRDDGHFPECSNAHRCMTELSCEKVYKGFVTVLEATKVDHS